MSTGTYDRSSSRVIEKARDNFDRFLHAETSGAIVLLVATVIALVIANSAAGPAVEHFWETDAGFFAGAYEFAQSFRHWVDDALMALFFFVVGLEIKRELIVGELSSLRGALLPIFAAIGGMVAPAAIYFALNAGGDGAAGWGVPMATDIAFAIGVIALLGSRVPTGLKVFLTALAIVDDIGAILVIALFYTESISTGWLFAALVPLAGLILMNRMRIDEPMAYLAVGSGLWICILYSGVHATIAGVIAALTVPAMAKIAPLEFANVCRIKIDEIEHLEVPGAHTLEDDAQQLCALDIQKAALKSTAPLQRLELALHPFSAFIILPLFALANAGIEWGGFDVGSPVVLGVILGLVVGKPIGITFMSWVVVRSGLASLPKGVTWGHILGAGIIAGIGFTMSLFVANLAFGAGEVAGEAKAAILVASVIAGTLGYVYLTVYTAKTSSAAA